MTRAGKPRPSLTRIAQDAGFLFSAGTLGIILSATERYGISDSPLTSPLAWGAAAASLTSAFMAARNTHPAHSLIANAAFLLSGSAYLLTMGTGAAFLIPAAMMMSLGVASVLTACEKYTGRKLPLLNSEAFVGLGGIGVAYTMGGGPAAFLAAGLAALGLYFSAGSPGQRLTERFRNAIKSRACFMGINIVSAGFALYNSENLHSLKTLSGTLGPVLLFMGNSVIARHNYLGLQTARDDETRRSGSPPAAPVV